MPTTPLRSALRAALAGAEPGFVFRTDADLLAAFSAERDEAAFAELVRRHGRLVRGTARRLAGTADAAEDVFQAVFLLMARKAAAGSWGPTVGPWLYQAALRLAARARTRAARRPFMQRIKTDVPAPATDSAAGLAWGEVHRALDRALAALPARLRDPLVLCYLEGLTRDEAATALGCSSAAIKGRVARGRERLRQLLAERGLALSAALAGTLVAEPAMRASEAAATARTAADFLATGVAPTAVRALLPLTVGWKLTAGLVGMVLACAAGVVALGRALPAGDPPPAAAMTDEAPPAQRPAEARTMRVIVLDPQGKPLAGAKVSTNILSHEAGVKAKRDYETDAGGTVRVELPKTFFVLRVWASKKPYVSMVAGWDEDELVKGVPVPAEYTIRLAPRVTIGGRMVNEQGLPIADAKVQVRLDHPPKPADSDGRTLYNAGEVVTTDADGRWHTDDIPDDPRVEVSLQVTHPDYVPNEHWRNALLAAGITTAKLREQTAMLTLKRGVILTGRVTDPAGKPVKGALVIPGDASVLRETMTDADGRFRLPAQSPEVTTLAVIAAGWAPQQRRVNLQGGLPPQEFRLEPGRSIRLRIVDTSGRPIPDPFVYVREWNGSRTLDNLGHSEARAKIPRKVRAAGLWEWTWAPADPLKLEIGAKGFAECELDIVGGAPERAVVLKAEHRVTGRVIDAVTGIPVPAFTVIPVDVFRKDDLYAERHNGKAGKGGRLDFLAWRTDIPIRLRIEAPGYRTQTGPEFRIGDDAARVQDFRLQPSLPITGLVFDAAGRPAAGAEVIMGTQTESADLRPREEHSHTTITDAAGRFSFPDPGEPLVVVARSDAGFVQAEFPADAHDTGTLRLQPWASVRGGFLDGGRPIAGAEIFLQPIRIRGTARPQIEAMMETVTGPDGRFEFARVPPGPVSVNVYIGPWKDEGFRSGPHVPLDLRPGQHLNLDLGGGGATVTGQVKLTGKVPADLDCSYSLNYLVRRETGIMPPQEIAALGFDARGGWRDSWRLSQEGIAYMQTLRSWFVKLAPDGSFRISGVPAGEYDLAVAVYAKPSGCLVEPLARQVVRVTVTAADAARGELKVPEIAAAVVPVPAVGDVPALAFRRADGSAGSLADVRGKYALVHFWASWCGPCKQQMPAVRRLHEQFAGRGLVPLGLSVDEDSAGWQAAVKRLELPWPQGRLEKAGDAGVSGVPVYWLLGPDGKIIAKAYDTDEIAKALAERLK
jgi:RNA polymerase sigma factor (sigma-70 family)